MGRSAWCLAWLLAAASPPGVLGLVPNPPECAVSITGLLAALSEAASRISWSTDSCMLGWYSGFGIGIDATAHNQHDRGQEYCAMQVSAAVKAFAKAAKFMSSAAFVCGNLDSGCAQQVFASLTNVAAIAEFASQGAYMCQESGMWCAGDVADVAVSIALLAQNVDTGLEQCSGINFIPPVPAGFQSGSESENPKPEPDGQEGDGAAAEGEGSANTLGSSFLPGMTIGTPQSPGGAERRLRAANASLVEPSVLAEARRQREELHSSMEIFHVQLQQVLRKAEFAHALRGEAVPEPLRTLEGRLANATAEARALAGASDVADQTQERLQGALAKLEAFQEAVHAATAAPSQGTGQPAIAAEPMIV